MSGGTTAARRVQPVDLYDLDTLDLVSVRGLLINGNCDQIFLERRRDLLTGFVTGGGRIAIMGHPLTDFLPASASGASCSTRAPRIWRSPPVNRTRCGRVSTAPTSVSGAGCPASTAAATARSCPTAPS